MKTDGSIVGDICPPRISIVGSAHFKGGIEIDSTKSPATADVGKRLSCTRASRAAQEHVPAGPEY